MESKIKSGWWTEVLEKEWSLHTTMLAKPSTIRDMHDNHALYAGPRRGYGLRGGVDQGNKEQAQREIRRAWGLET